MPGLLARLDPISLVSQDQAARTVEAVLTRKARGSDRGRPMKMTINTNGTIEDILMEDGDSEPSGMRSLLIDGSRLAGNPAP